MFVRLSAFMVGAGLLAGVVYLGVLSGADVRIVPWFGIASAIGAPVGLSLVTFACLPSNVGAIRSLAKIPQIDALVKKAETAEERVAQLEKARSDLDTLIEVEARRYATLDRRSRLEDEAGRILSEFEAVEKELSLIDAGGEETKFAKDAIEGLRERVSARKRGDIVLQFGTRTFVVERSLLAALPFGLGSLMATYLRLIEKLQEWRRPPAA